MSTTVTPSMLAAAGRCMRMVYYQNVLRIKSAPGVARALGSAYHHQILDVDQAARLRGDIYPVPLEELIEGWSKDVAAAIETVPDEDDVIQRFGSRQATYAVMQKAAVHGFKAYGEQRAFFEQARAVEVKFDVPFAAGNMIGYLDMDVSDSLFADLKCLDGTKKRVTKKTPLQVYHDRQFAAYAAAKWRMSKGTLPHQDIAAVFLTASDKKAETSVIGQTRGLEAHKETEELAYVVQRAIEADVYPPVDKSGSSGFWCSKAWCSAWPTTLPDGKPGCPFGERARSAAITVPEMPEGD